MSHFQEPTHTSSSNYPYVTRFYSKKQHFNRHSDVLKTTNSFAFFWLIFDRAWPFTLTLSFSIPFPLLWTHLFFFFSFRNSPYFHMRNGLLWKAMSHQSASWDYWQKVNSLKFWNNCFDKMEFFSTYINIFSYDSIFKTPNSFPMVSNLYPASKGRK